jgi:DNA-binding transcriptional ArsR family regulator
MSNTLTDNLDRLAEVFGALSNPNRLQIFLRLMTCCPRDESCVSEEQAKTFVGELGQDLGIAPSTVSHHIKELRRSGLIQMTREGQRVACCADPETLDALAQFFSRRQEA